MQPLAFESPIKSHNAMEMLRPQNDSRFAISFFDTLNAN